MATTKNKEVHSRVYGSKLSIFVISLLLIGPSIFLLMTAAILLIFEPKSSTDALIDMVIATPLLAIGVYWITALVKTEFYINNEVIELRGVKKVKSVKIGEVKSILVDTSPAYRNPTAVLKIVISDHTAYNYIEIPGLPQSFSTVKPILKELYDVTQKHSIETDPKSRIFLEAAHNDVKPKINLWKPEA